MIRGSRHIGRVILAVVAGILCSPLMAKGQAESPVPFRPSFDKARYEVVVGVSPAGIGAFSISGKASTILCTDIVQIVPDNFPLWSTFSTTPGNPATFSLVSNGLPMPQTGVYDSVITAVSETSGFSFADIRIRLVVPEPGLGALVIAGGISLLTQRSRRKSSHH
jgi:hypothetical protein